jgi:hypothetical protein
VLGLCRTRCIRLRIINIWSEPRRLSPFAQSRLHEVAMNPLDASVTLTAARHCLRTTFGNRRLRAAHGYHLEFWRRRLLSRVRRACHSRCSSLCKEISSVISSASCKTKTYSVHATTLRRESLISGTSRGASPLAQIRFHEVAMNPLDASVILTAARHSLRKTFGQLVDTNLNFGVVRI